MNQAERGARPQGAAVAVFLAVIILQLAFVAATGTDIPIFDQWNVEGRWLYPSWVEGRLGLGDLLRPANEHRIVWTYLLDLTLFAANGQWDPLVQLFAIAILRAGVAGGLAWLTLRGMRGGAAIGGVAVLVIAFSPHLAWHAVLWGFESQVCFALGLSLATIAMLNPAELSARRIACGTAMGVAALLAMAPAALVPVALLGLVVLRACERRRFTRVAWRQVLPAILLLLLAFVLRVSVPEHAELQAKSLVQFVSAAAKVLGWPHVNAPLASLALNAPVLVIIVGRLLRRRVAVRGEDFVLAVAGWSVGMALATAWARGGGVELSVGVPSRYVDFVLLLPLTNAWCAFVLAREWSTRWRPARWLAAAWALFLAVGWIGLSAEVMRGLVLPRAQDREAPTRLVREFQASGNADVFVGQPRLLVPHPNPEVVRAVLEDPRLRGMLPPSLQPEEPMGPLSRGVRGLLGRE